MRSSTSSLALMHMTGTADNAGVARISAQMSMAVRTPSTTSRMTSW